MLSPAKALSVLPEIDRAALGRFQVNGHVLVRGLLDPKAVAAVRPAVMAAVERSGRLAVDLASLDSAYERAFVQVVNAGLGEPAIRALTHSRRLGAWVAALLGATGARVMLEDTFLKPAGADLTPWHQDASVAPVDPDAVLTAWIPLETITPRMGGLRVVLGSHRRGLLGPVDISEDSHRHLQGVIEDQAWPIWDAPPMQPGDVSFHRGMTIHGAYANRSEKPRLAIALHCFAEGAVVAPVRSPQQERLLRYLGPGLSPGDLAVSKFWPRIYPASEPRS